MLVVLRLEIEERNHAAHLDCLELDDAPALGQRLGRGFEDADHPQAGLAVGRAASVLLDAVDELPQLEAERLGHVELRRPHVAGAVADQHLIASSRRCRCAALPFSVMPLS